MQKKTSAFPVGLPGLEPGKTGPESVVLPLHHSPNFKQNNQFRFRRCKYTTFLIPDKKKDSFFTQERKR